jgi:hypothetical protein
VFAAANWWKGLEMVGVMPKIEPNHYCQLKQGLQLELEELKGVSAIDCMHYCNS